MPLGAETEGVAASFMKELMRKAALIAAERAPGDGAIAVTDDDTRTALDELLSERGRLTRALLGGPGSGHRAVRPSGLP